MNNLERNNSELKEIERLVKPNTLNLILSTLVFSSPYGHLIFKIISKDYSDLMLNTLLIFPTLILLFYYWNKFFYSYKTYKEVSKEIFAELNKDKY
ncbi:MAG: hypothetical protein AB7V48_09445 [Sedimentibacter sp.]